MIKQIVPFNSILNRQFTLGKGKYSITTFTVTIIKRIPFKIKKRDFN